MRSIFVIAGLVALIAVPVHAATVAATGEGWCGLYAVGGERCGNTDTSLIRNTYAGNSPGEGVFRDWFAFNIPSLGGPVLNATLWIWNHGWNSTQDPSGTYTLYNPSAIDYASLAVGPGLGSVTAAVADTGVSHYVGIPLNATALSLLNAAQGSQFLFGGAVDIIDPSLLVEFFGYTDGTPVAMLDLNSTAIPEPGMIGMLLGGLAALGLARRRRLV
ncbi:MAG: PEP-CTERM sorting domain-containing protein [Bryobacteraceae bacterium]